MYSEFDAGDSKVSFVGELKFTDHPVFRTIITRLLGAQNNEIVIDLSRLTFMDSAGLGMLLIAREETAKVNRNLVLRSPKGQVQRIFKISKFDKLFTIEP